MSIQEKVETWAEKNGLEAEVYDAAHSWYYPGRTCFIVIHLPRVSILVD